MPMLASAPRLCSKERIESMFEREGAVSKVKSKKRRCKKRGGSAFDYKCPPRRVQYMGKPDGPERIWVIKQPKGKKGALGKAGRESGRCDTGPLNPKEKRNVRKRNTTQLKGALFKRERDRLIGLKVGGGKREGASKIYGGGSKRGTDNLGLQVAGWEGSKSHSWNSGGGEAVSEEGSRMDKGPAP